MKTKIKALAEALNDPSPDVRSAAAISLGKVGDGRESVQALAAMLTREYEPARQSAADALMVIGDKSAVDEIVKYLSHPQAAVRFAVLSAISAYLEGSIPRRAASISKLISGKAHGWLNVRESSDGITVGDSVSVIVKALVSRSREDPSRRIREGALEALKSLQEILSATRSGRYRIRKSCGDSDFGGMDDDDGWGGPEEVKVAIGPSRAETAAASAIETAEGNVPESRYADITFYAAGPSSPKEKKDAIFHALRSEQNYLMEIAVKVNPSGVPFSGRQRPSIYEPRQKENVTIWVTAEGDGLDIQNPTQTLTLPPKGDSTAATFKVKPLPEAVGRTASVLIRLYYNFNLIEEVVANLRVSGKFDSSSAGSEAAMSFDRRLERPYIDFDDILPREMHIDVKRRGAQFVFVFTFYNKQRGRVEFTAPILLQATDLEDKLVSLRTLLYDIAMSNTFTKQLEGDEDEFIANVRTLATAGQDLWTTLFKREVNSPLYKVGQWLEKHPLAHDAIIQVSIGPDAADFMFPWALIYDRPLPAENYVLPDPAGFWGIRYSIEQQPPNMRLDANDLQRIEHKLKLVFVVWEQFRNANLEKSMLQHFHKRSNGKLSVFTPPVNDAAIAMNILGEFDANILYFYTHGYTRPRQADIRVGPDLDLFVKRYESLTADSPLRATHKLLYDSIKQGEFLLTRSWIEPTYGKLFLDDLYRSINPFLSEPFVILNMCESAQVTPSLADSFIHFFLDRGARGVLGTECPMTIEFAHPFAEKFLQELFAGSPAGSALLKARRYFMDLRNPLGLAYTLFGSATLRFEPPILN